MRGRATVRTILMGALLLAAPAGNALGAPDGADDVAATDKARELHREGEALYRKGEYAKARVSFLAAWSLKKHYTLAGNLGDCEVKLGLYRDAAQHLALYLRESAKEKPPSEGAKELYAQARSKVGTLELTVRASGAEVLIDGKVVGTAPLLDPVFVEPGSHLVEVRLGANVASSTVELGPGATQPLRMSPAVPIDPSTLGPRERGMAPASSEVAAKSEAPLPPPPVEEGKRNWVPVAVLGAASVVGLGVGIGMTVASNGEKADAVALRAAIRQDGGRCVQPTSAFVERCRELESQASQAEDLGNATILTYVAAGTLAGAAVVYALWPRKPATSGVRAWPTLHVGGSGVAIGGVW